MIFIQKPSQTGKFRAVRAPGLSRAKKCPLDVLLCTVQRTFFHSEEPIHPGLPRNYSWSGRLACPKPKNCFWAYYFVQPGGIFSLGRTYSSRPVTKLGSVRSGWPISCSGTKTSLNVPSAYSPERYFSPRNNLCIPACRKIMAGLGD